MPTWTTSSLIQGIVSLEEFLSKINYQSIKPEEEEREFNQSINTASFASFDDFGHMPSDEAQMYSRIKVKVERDWLKFARWEIFKNATIQKINKTSMDSLMEDMAVASAMQHGHGDWIIDLGNNMFLIAQLNDYKFYGNSKGKALCVLNKPRCIIFHMSKFDNSKYVTELKNE